MYCAETWTLRKEDITRLEAFEMRIWLRTEKISWTEHISNEVLKLVEEERSLLTIIIVIVISKLLKRHSKAKRRAPAYSRALRQIIKVFQRIVRGGFRSG